MVKHTLECKEQSELAVLEQYAWIEKHPGYCHDCQGRGAFYEQYDPSPVGVSLSSGYQTQVEVCIACVGKGRCPRCGKLAWQIMEDELPDTPCMECGFAWGNNPDDFMPEFSECACYEVLSWQDDQADQDYYQRVLRGEE